MSKIRIMKKKIRGALLFYGFYGTTIFEKTDSGACRGSFFMENQVQARNFSIYFLNIGAMT